MSVLGVVKDRQDLNSEEVSITPVAKAKKTEKTPESTKDKGKSVQKHGSPANVAKPSTDSKSKPMGQKWSEHFSRLEAMLLSETFNHPEAVFQPVVVSPPKLPPASAVDNTQPFFEPQLTDQPATLHQKPAHWPKSDNQPVPTNQPSTDWFPNRLPVLQL